MIARAIIENPERMAMMTQAEAAPQDINSKITQLNLQGRLDAHTCTIQLMSIWSRWHAINGVNILEANKPPRARRRACATDAMIIVDS
jgi:hypothetical protein